MPRTATIAKDLPSRTIARTPFEEFKCIKPNGMVCTLETFFKMLKPGYA